MKQNVGSLDTVIRVMIGLALLLAAGVLVKWPAMSIGLVVVSLPLFWTALRGSCPLYSFLGVDTLSAGDRASREAK
jgi:Protein of unknown function (DUF2892)